MRVERCSLRKQILSILCPTKFRPADVHRERMAFEQDSARAQGSWLRLSTNARQIFDYDEANQYIQLDHPRVVLDAIRDVFRTVAFRDCAQCPAMVVVPAGNFTLGSPASEKVWAASHGARFGAVADEAPQHTVSLQAGEVYACRSTSRNSFRETLTASKNTRSSGQSKKRYGPRVPPIAARPLSMARAKSFTPPSFS
jgi:formylglycine-generating enzyme required for sulfatase activity